MNGQIFRSSGQSVVKLPEFSFQASLVLIYRPTEGMEVRGNLIPGFESRNSDDYVKSLVYADKPQTLDHLEDNIRRVIADIRPQMLEKVIENWTSRLDYIRASRGSPMPEILFKM
ncbi:hypothetical protein TNCV_3163991 [Trichonephila clavipes]|nr:hypothetical protein TNCV_3163991 [Trichonephila clavipes]